MNVGSLFSGIGGIELGFEAEGFKTEWFVECDPYAKAILRKRFPNTAIYDDVTKVDFGAVPKVDILTGGFPCQDISNAGKRVGITGSRSSLWKYYRDAIRGIRPKYALIENVAALTKRGLNIVLGDLAEIGYDAEWYNLSASAVGAHHRRERIFIIAYPHGGGQLHSKLEEQSNQGGEQALSLSLSLARAVTMLPTPTTDADRKTPYAQGGRSLMFAMYRTPSATELMRGIGKMSIEEKKAKNIQISLASQIREKEGTGQLNPEFVEWLMGFPIGFTELSASETQSFLNARKSSRKLLKNMKEIQNDRS